MILPVRNAIATARTHDLGTDISDIGMAVKGLRMLF